MKKNVFYVVIIIASFLISCGDSSSSNKDDAEKQEAKKQVVAKNTTNNKKAKAKSDEYKFPTLNELLLFYLEGINNEDRIGKDEILETFEKWGLNEIYFKKKKMYDYDMPDEYDKSDAYYDAYDFVYGRNAKLDFVTYNNKEDSSVAVCSFIPEGKNYFVIKLLDIPIDETSYNNGVWFDRMVEVIVPNQDYWNKMKKEAIDNRMIEGSNTGNSFSYNGDFCSISFDIDDYGYYRIRFNREH